MRMTAKAMTHSMSKGAAGRPAECIVAGRLMDQERMPRETLAWLGRRLGLIGHPDRLHILLLLQKHRELCVCQVIAKTGLPQPRVSQLLQKLRAGRLVEGRREGRRMLYILAKDALLGELMVFMERLQVRGDDKKNPA